MTKQKSVLVAVFATIMWLSMILPMQIQVQAEDDGEFVGGGDGSSDSGDSGDSSDGSDGGGTTEDDGYIIGPDDSQGEVSSQDELEDTYKDTPWEKKVGPNDFEKAKQRDDNSKEDLPLCKWGVKEDCKVKDGMTCKVKDADDPCMDIWGGFTGETDAEFQKRVGKIVESSTYPKPDCDKVSASYTGTCRDSGSKSGSSSSSSQPKTKPTNNDGCADGLYTLNVYTNKCMFNFANTPGELDGADGKCDDGFVMNIKQVCVNKVFCEQTPTASGCKFNNTPAPVSQAIPPTNDPSRTSFDLISCKYFGAQDAMNIKQMDYTLYLKCDNYPKTGDNAYASGYADVVNARNNSILPKP
jgi:hypothetical protein